MSIKEQVNELNNLNMEIKRLREQIKTLSLRKSKVEDSICSYLKMNNDPGLKYKNTAIVMSKKTTRKRLKKNEIENVTSYVLNKYGMNNEKTRFMVNELLESRRGEKVDSDKLIYKKIKKK